MNIKEGEVSSQEIYEKLLNEDNFKNGLNPYEINKAISEYNYRLKEERSEMDPDIFFENLGMVSTPELLFESSCLENNSNDTLEFLNSNFREFDDMEDSNDSDLLEELDKVAANFSNTESKKINFLELDTLLDQMLNKEEEINLINFDSEHRNIYELETTPTLEKLDLYKEEDIPEEEIINILIGDKKDSRRIGSSLQRTIKVFDLYGVNKLIYKDEAIDLAELILKKLLSYKNIILDFDKIIFLNESFLRGTFELITKYLDPNDIMEQIDIINIEDSVEVNIRENIIPNAFAYWRSNTNESKHYEFAKHELIKTLDPNSALVLTNPEKVKIKEIPFKKLTSRFRKFNREFKLRYPIWYIERVTEEVLEKFNVDQTIENFIDLIVPEIDENKLRENCSKQNTSNGYHFMIPEDIFPRVYDFTHEIILKACSDYLDGLIEEIEFSRKEIEEIKKNLPKKLVAMGGVCFQNLYLDDKLLASFPEIVRMRLQRIEELEFILLDLEHKYMIKEDILRNVFEYIPFTYYEIKLDKVKLIAYHYIAKYYEKKSLEFKEKLQIKWIRGFKLSIEMFRFDLIKVLCEDQTLRRFIFSMKELIEKWVFRYSQNSKIAKFYYDIMMVTPETLEESLLRSLCLTIIKNKNPMTLRAVYSSYVSLVHLILDSTINLTDLSTRKYGAFSSFQRMNNQMDNDNYLYTQSKKFTNSYPEEMFLKVYLYKNPKLLNPNYFLIKRLNLNKFLEINSLRIFATKPDGIGLYDWYWYYINFYQYIDKEIVYKIKSRFLKSDKRNSQLKIIEIMTQDILFDKLYSIIGDVECVSEILGVIAEDISIRTINRGYMDENFNLIVKSNQDYLNYIHTSLVNIRDKI